VGQAQSSPLAVCMGLVVLGFGASYCSSGSNQAAPTVETAPQVQVADAAPAIRDNPDATQQADVVKALINLNGHLCATILDVRPRQSRDGAFEVTCIEYRGGSGQVRYLVDGQSGTASRF
jgi:hypothetical protein